MQNLNLLRHCRATNGLLMSAIVLLLFSCRKATPTQIPCECDPDTESNSVARAASKDLYVCGTLHLPIDTSQGNATIVAVAIGNRFAGLYNLPELGPEGNQVFVVDDKLHINAHLFQYVVNADISDLKGNPLVQIADNKWYVYKENIGKYNYDAKSLEVYDKSGRIVLSIDARLYHGSFDASLVVQGIVPENENSLNFYSLTSLYPSYGFSYGTATLNKTFDSVYHQYPIMPIFRYTGPSWQHARL